MYEIWTKKKILLFYILNINIKPDYFIVTPRTTIFHCHFFVHLKKRAGFLHLTLVTKKKNATNCYHQSVRIKKLSASI